MKNKDVRERLIELYSYKCMIGGNIQKYNPLTMHHIIFKKDNGKTNIYNGSNIAHLEHSGVHILSELNKTKKIIIMNQLRYYKEFRDELSRYQFYEWFNEELRKIGCEPEYSKTKKLFYRRK